MIYIKTRYRRRTTVVVLMILCLALKACGQASSPTITPLPTLYPNPPPYELPAFLSYVYPKPGEVVIQSKRPGRRNWATLYLEEMLRPDETLELEEIQERVEFMLDDEPMDIEIVQGYRPNVAEARIIGMWVPRLGEHEAAIRVRKTSGEALEYTWTFTVVDEELSLPGLPDVLQFVRPLPGSTITLQAYREEQLIPYYYAPRFPFDFRQSVCAGLHPRRIEEINESRDANEVSVKYAFVALDSVPPELDAPIWNGYNEGEIYHYDEAGNIVVETPVGWHYKCWWVDLTSGEHEATVRVEKASGEEIEYTWQFTITSD